MPNETIDRDAVAAICHTSADHARHYVKRINRITCAAALGELDRMARSAVKAGKKAPYYTTLRNLIDARLRKLGKEAATV